MKLIYYIYGVITLFERISTTLIKNNNFIMYKELKIIELKKCQVK